MKLSIRHQLLAFITVILVAALVSYLVLATRLIESDKLAYTFDLNASLANARAEEVEASLTVLADRLSFFAQQVDLHAAATSRRQVAQSLFESEPTLVALESWERRAGTYERAERWVSDDAQGYGIDEVVLERAGREYPTRVALVDGDAMHVTNVSLQPDIVLLQVAVRSRDGKRVSLAIVYPEHLLKVMGSSELYHVYLVDPAGNVLIHSDRSRIIEHASFLDRPVVREALQGPVARAVSRFEAPDGGVIGAFSRLKNMRLTVVSEVPVAEAQRATRALTRRSITFGLAVCLVTLALSVFLTRRLVTPIQRLTQLAGEISRGAVGSTVPVTGADEISTLTSTFNDMSRALAGRESRYLAMVNTLGAGVAHEINNPLASVVAGQFLVKETLSELLPTLRGQPEIERELRGALEVLGDASDAADRITQIVRDLRNFSDTGRGGTAPLGIERVMEGCLKLVHQEIKYRARLVRDYHDVPPVLANETRLAQVFVNLLVNAAQAVPEGSVDDNEIRVSTRLRDDGKVAIAIADTGSGIPREAMDRIFDPFFTTKDPGIGTGLGLAITRDLVERMEGSISVQSTVGVGTTVTVTLLAAAANEQPVVEPAVAQEAPVVEKRGHLLVVDDDPHVGEALRRLIGQGRQVEVVTSGRVAMERLRTGGTFDLILCDLMMSEVTGMELYETMCQQRPEIVERFVFMTGATFTDWAAEFVAKVPNDCIEKPFDPQALRALVDQRVAAALQPGRP